jgi:hypothetical protein
VADAGGAGEGDGRVGDALGLGRIGAVGWVGGLGGPAPALGLSVGLAGAVGEAGASLVQATSPAPSRAAPRSVAANSLSTAGARVLAD